MDKARPHTISSFALDPKESGNVHNCSMGKMWIPEKVDSRFCQVWKLIRPPVHLTVSTVKAMPNAPLNMRAGVHRVSKVLLCHEVVSQWALSHTGASC
jgi:hypothetical protein